MVNYSNGKIYKIVPTNGDDTCYVGSTTKQYLSQRMDVHRNDFKKWQKNNNQRKTTSIELFEKYGVENCKIELIENFPCNSKDELEKKEAEYIKALNCINKRGAGGVSISGMVRKVKPTPQTCQESDESDNISVLSDSSVSETKSETNPIPSNTYLINLRNEYMKYEYLYEKIDRDERWNENNSNVDLNYHLKKHNYRMTYILVDLRDAKLPIE